MDYDRECLDVDVHHKHHGRCQCLVMCPMIHDPVCGTNGQSYGNECALNAAVTCLEAPAGTSVDHAGYCN